MHLSCEFKCSYRYCEWSPAEVGMSHELLIQLGGEFLLKQFPSSHPGDHLVRVGVVPTVRLTKVPHLPKEPMTVALWHQNNYL